MSCALPVVLGRRVSPIGFNILRLVARVDAERGERSLGGTIMRPRSSYAARRRAWRRLPIRSFLRDVAGGVALELGGDREMQRSSRWQAAVRTTSWE